MGKKILHQFARGADGRLIDATRANAGVRQFTCPQCGAEMVLKQGPLRAWHFAHKSETDCTGEGVLHWAAKETIAERLRDHLMGNQYPVYLKCPRSELCRLMPYELPSFASVEVESAIFGVRPDITLFDSNASPVVAIEVVVSHEQDPATARILDANRVRVLPLRLTGGDETVRALRQDLIFVPPTKTPHHQIHLPSRGITWGPMAPKIATWPEQITPEQPKVESLGDSSNPPEKGPMDVPTSVEGYRVNYFSGDYSDLRTRRSVGYYGRDLDLAENVGVRGDIRTGQWEGRPAIRANPEQGTNYRNEPFGEIIATSSAKDRPLLRRLLRWAERLEESGYVRLMIKRGPVSTVRLSLLDENACLAAIYAAPESGRMTLHATVLRRRVATHVLIIERLIAPQALKQTTSVRAVPDDLLEVLASAYQAAADEPRI